MYFLCSDGIGVAEHLQGAFSKVTNWNILDIYSYSQDYVKFMKIKQVLLYLLVDDERRLQLPTDDGWNPMTI